jgi:hypothetical protein
MLFVRGGAVDFALGAQMSRELVTDEVGKAARLTLRPRYRAVDSTATFGSGMSQRAARHCPLFKCLSDRSVE